MATFFPINAPLRPPRDPQKGPKIGPRGGARGGPGTGGMGFLRLNNSKPVLENTPLFVTSKGGALDVTFSLQRFMGKMASVRQILPRAPLKDTLSDPHAIGPSHYQAGFACLDRLFQTTALSVLGEGRLAPLAK